MEVFSPSKFKLSVNALINIFNASMEMNYTEFNDELVNFLDDPYNRKNSPVGSYCPSSVFQNWLEVDKKLVDEETFVCFRNALIEAGWDVKEFKWQKDERTCGDILYVYVSK